MDDKDLRAAFHAGFALGRTGQIYSDVKLISRRPAHAAFKRWYARYDPIAE